MPLSTLVVGILLRGRGAFPCDSIVKYVLHYTLSVLTVELPEFHFNEEHYRTIYCFCPIIFYKLIKNNQKFYNQ